jgi:uncharacterized protein (TIGR03086 family)
VSRLIALGRDREAAELAVRDAGAQPPDEENAVLGPLEQLDVIIPTFLRLSGAVDGSTIQATTPCEGWVVRDLFEHINGGARAFTAAFDGRAIRERPLGDEPVVVLREALEAFDDAIRQPGALEQMIESPFGVLPGEAFARLAALDLLVHTWDLGRATGQTLDVPDPIVESVAAFAHQAVTGDLRRPGLFGHEQAAAPMSSPVDALAAFTGRQP